MYQIIPRFINRAVSHLWWGPKSKSVAYFIFTVCVCYVFHGVCDILSGCSLSIVGEDDPANIYGKFLNIQRIKRHGDGPHDICLCQDASPKGQRDIFILRNAEMLFWDLSCTSGQDELFFSFTKHPVYTYRFRPFTDVLVYSFINKSSQTFTLYWWFIGKRCCFAHF